MVPVEIVETFPPPPGLLGLMGAPVTEMVAWPPHEMLALVRPVIVKEVVLDWRLISDRGEIVTIASGTPSRFSSTGSAATVTFWKSTPLMKTAAGLMSVTGRNGGVLFRLL